MCFFKRLFVFFIAFFVSPGLVCMDQAPVASRKDRDDQEYVLLSWQCRRLSIERLRRELEGVEARKKQVETMKCAGESHVDVQKYLDVRGRIEELLEELQDVCKDRAVRWYRSLECEQEALAVKGQCLLRELEHKRERKLKATADYWIKSDRVVFALLDCFFTKDDSFYNELLDAYFADPEKHDRAFCHSRAHKRGRVSTFLYELFAGNISPEGNRKNERVVKRFAAILERAYELFGKEYFLHDTVGSILHNAVPELPFLSYHAMLIIAAVRFFDDKKILGTLLASKDANGNTPLAFAEKRANMFFEKIFKRYQDCV